MSLATLISTRLTIEQYTELCKLASSKNLPISTYIRNIINNHIKENKK